MDLTKLTNLQTVGSDAFSSIVGLKEVKLTEGQAKIVNPGVFSRSQTDSSDDKSFEISIGSGGSFSPTTWPNTTVTVANNLNRLDKIQTIDLSQTNITTLAGGVLFNNQSITKLVLPATASNWKLTDVNSYESAPLGKNGALVGNGGDKGIFFENFTLNLAPSAQSKKKNSDPLFSQLNATTWSQVASILNMFGRVESDDKPNLAIWSENFKGPELDANSVKLGWADSADKAQKPDQSNQQITEGTSSAMYKRVNNLTWTYKKESGNITLTADTSSKPNLYRAGYTGNPYAFYQVGFADNGSGKIDTTKTVEVKLTLVGQ